MEPKDTITLPVNDIITPDAIDFWPPAFGWWLLLGLLIVSLLVGIRYLKRHRQFWSYRKAAIDELENIINKRSMTKNDIATEIMSVLKRVSMTTYHDQSYTKLEGQRFLAFANSTLKHPAFSKNNLNNIDGVLYNQQQNIDINSFYKEACRWIKEHPAQITNDKQQVNHV